MRLMNSIATGIAFSLGMMLFVQSALSAEKIGNGGGAWVCRETDGSIRWSKLVDLFEATDEFGLATAQYPGSTHEVVDQVLQHLSKANRDLSDALVPYLRQLNDLESNPPQVTYTDNIVETIDDSLYRLKPSPKRCAGGTVAYEQVVNYKADGWILVESEVFNSLSSNMKAAMVLHEAIYKCRRDTAGDTNSVLTRRIVGLLFSTLSTDDLKKQLEALGEQELSSYGMKFVRIPAGSFIMGSPDSEPGRRAKAETQHQVTLTHSFDMQTTAITQAQYAQVMGKNPSFFQKQENCESTYEVRQNVGMCPNYPVEMISYPDALAFVAKLNSIRQDGYLYRLPTEAEWEYAARAGTTTIYYFGADPKSFSQYEWIAGHQTHEVGKLRPNGYGLYDMLGNVMAWVSDWYGDADSNPVTDPVGPSSGVQRVLRGGAWGMGTFPRVASRGVEYPELERYYQGIRLVRTAR